MVWGPLLFPDTWQINLDTAQRRGLALRQCVVTDQALCSASTSPVQPWECFSLHGSWMSKKYLFVSSPAGRVIFCLHSLMKLIQCPEEQSSFDHVSSAYFAEQISANFWSVVGNAVLISKQPILQPDVGLWLEAMGFLTGHLLWQQSYPGPPGPQVTASSYTFGFTALPVRASWDILTGRTACGQLWELHRSLWWNLKSS